MRPHTDEVLAPIFKQHLDLLERVEDLAIQQFVPELTVEAFVVAVLPRASRFDKQSFAPTRASQSRTLREVISGPLSERM